MLVLYFETIFLLQLETIRKEAGLKPTKEDTILNCQNIDILQKSSNWNGMKDQNRLMTTEEVHYMSRIIIIIKFPISAHQKYSIQEMYNFC